MTKKTLTTLFSRLLFVLGGLMAILFSFYIIQTTLTPISVPPAPPLPKNVSFDPTLDVTKNILFGQLRPIGPREIEAGSTGRENPFEMVATSTESRASATSETTKGIVPAAVSSTPSL